MPDIFIILVLFLLGFLALGFASYGESRNDYRPLKCVVGLIIAIIIWVSVYLSIPYRIEKTYEVKPEYNKDKTIQFITLEQPNKYEEDKVVITYPLFKRFLKDDEVVVVKQRDKGYYVGFFPISVAQDRNSIEIKDSNETHQ